MEFPLSYLGDNLSPRGSHNAPWSDPPPPPPPRTRQADGQGRPPEFAALVCHLVENQMLNGETVRLDGALRMPPR